MKEVRPVVVRSIQYIDTQQYGATQQRTSRGIIGPNELRAAAQHNIRSQLSAALQRLSHPPCLRGGSARRVRSITLPQASMPMPAHHTCGQRPGQGGLRWSLAEADMSQRARAGCCVEGAQCDSLASKLARNAHLPFITARSKAALAWRWVGVLRS